MPYKTRITYCEEVLISLTTFSVISKSLTFEDHYCSLHWKISICYFSHLGWYANVFLYQKSMFFSNQTLWWYQPTARIGASRFGFFPSNNFFFCSVGVQFQTVLMVMNREHKKSPCFIQFRIRRAKKFLGEKVKRLVYYVVVDKKEWICWRQETNEKKSYSHYIVHSILHSLAFWLNYYETASGDIMRDEIVLVGRTEPKLFLSFKIEFRSWRNSKSLV